MENRIIALEKSADRQEKIIESLRAKLDEIHASLSRVETRLNGRGEPGVSEFCRQHMSILTGFGDRITKVETSMTSLDKDLSGLKIRISVWVAVIVVVVQFFGPYLRKLIGIP